MRRTSFSDMPCSIARTLEIVGDWWTLLIVREAFFGRCRFGEFEKALGIAPNVLINRLGKLVEGGILVVSAESQNGRAMAYRLSPKGRDLFPILVAMVQWGDQHSEWPEGPPVRIVERSTGRDIAPLVMRSQDGKPLGVRDVTAVAGPGASEATRRHLEALGQPLQGKG
jgi:DNA-binding HxlR family transcriptional regulator